MKKADMLENVRKGQRTKDDKENRNTFSIKTNEEDAKESNGIENQLLKCTFCKKTDHELDGCSKFKFETLATRMTFAKENRLCFGCLKKGQASKDCRRRLTCSTCNKKHPTCVHEDSIQAKKEERKVGDSTCVPESTSCTLQGVSHTSTSMIVPVWLSTSSRPDKEVLVYAMLDNQSDAIFVLDEVCSELSADKTSTEHHHKSRRTCQQPKSKGSACLRVQYQPQDSYSHCLHKDNDSHQ